MAQISRVTHLGTSSIDAILTNANTVPVCRLVLNEVMRNVWPYLIHLAHALRQCFSEVNVIRHSAFTSPYDRKHANDNHSIESTVRSTNSHAAG